MQHKISEREIFSFTEENINKARDIIKNYPENRQASAVLPLLDLAQRQNSNWLSVPAIEYVAKMLDMPFIRVYEVASFYTMFNLEPVNKYHIQICTTTPCLLRGAEDLFSACARRLNLSQKGGNSSDGIFTLNQIECLGACVNAPVVMVNDDYLENLSLDELLKFIEKKREEEIAKRKKNNT